MKHQVSFSIKTYDVKNPTRGQLEWKKRSFSNVAEAIAFIRNVNNGQVKNQGGRIIGKPVLEEVA